MAEINLTTLFGINPSITPARMQPINFRGSEKITVFNPEGLEPGKDRFSTNPFRENFKSKVSKKK